VPQALAILNRLYYLRTTKLLVGYSSCSSPLILAGGASRDTICLASPARAATGELLTSPIDYLSFSSPILVHKFVSHQELEFELGFEVLDCGRVGACESGRS